MKVITTTYKVIKESVPIYSLLVYNKDTLRSMQNKARNAEILENCPFPRKAAKIHKCTYVHYCTFCALIF
jgi:hypothetical protein